MNTDERKQFATSLCERGWTLCKIKTGCKTPFEKRWNNKTYDNPDVVASWWSDSDINYGIVAGLVFTLNGVEHQHIIIDVDQNEAKGKKGLQSFERLEAKFGEIDKKFVVRSPSGGFHIHVLAQLSETGLKWGCSAEGFTEAGYQHIDVRGEGGQTLGPGSRLEKCQDHDAGDYRLINGSSGVSPSHLPILPSSWLQFLRCENKKHKDAGKWISGAEPDCAWAVEKAKKYLTTDAADSECGNRNNTTYEVAARLFDFGLTRETAMGMILEYYQSSLGLPELESVVDSASRNRQNQLGIAQPWAGFAPIDTNSEEFIRLEREIVERQMNTERETIKSVREHKQKMDIGRDTPFKEDLFKRFRYLKQLNSFLDVSDCQVMKKDVLNHLFAGVFRGYKKNDTKGYPTGPTIKAENVYLQNHKRRQIYDGIGYFPGQSHVVKWEGETRFNTWIAPEWWKTDLQGAEKDWALKAAPWLEHMTYMIPDQKFRNHFLSYLAYTVQHPEDKINHGILIIGKSRTGKDVGIVEVIKAVMGSSHVGQPDATMLEDKYSDYLENKKIIIFNEVKQGRRWDIANKIKRFLAAPPDTLNIRAMHKTEYKIPNIINVLAFSNHEDAIAIENGDARWAIYKSPANPKSDPDYYRALVDWRNQNHEALTGYLRTFDWRSRGFQPKAHAPFTTDKEHVRRASMGPDAQVVFDWQDEDAAFTGVSIFSLLQVKNCFDRVDRFKIKMPSSDQRIARLLKDCGYHRIKKIRIGKKMIPVWCHSKDSDRWETANDDELRAAYSLGEDIISQWLFDGTCGKSRKERQSHKKCDHIVQ